ncbi:MAG: hypothetical protein AAGA85_02320 [Bacteroidota bacterium]
MEIEEFENLRPDEIEAMINAPIYVAILIAGADGKIDKSERKEAIDVARSKQSRAREQLVTYYKAVGESFEAKFNKFVDELPEDVKDRTSDIEQELRKLNHILPKIDRVFAIKFYASIKDLAKKIAEASGGIFGYLSVSYEEQTLMDLKMINDPEKIGA